MHVSAVFQSELVRNTADLSITISLQITAQELKHMQTVAP